MPRLNDADYESMADSYESEPLTSDEVLSVEVRMGRPRADEQRNGVSPSMSVRFPGPVRSRIKERAVSEFSGNEADVVRAAVMQFLGAAPLEEALAEKRRSEAAEPSEQPAGENQVAQAGDSMKVHGRRTVDQSDPEVVQERADGKWEVRRIGARRASVVVSTQAEAVAQARALISRNGGGELQVRGKDGQIRAQDPTSPSVR